MTNLKLYQKVIPVGDTSSEMVAKKVFKKFEILLRLRSCFVALSLMLTTFMTGVGA